ncbi:MAG: VirB8/TrbF family protein [Lentisphaerota bacterium]
MKKLKELFQHLKSSILGKNFNIHDPNYEAEMLSEKLKLTESEINMNQSKIYTLELLKRKEEELANKKVELSRKKEEAEKLKQEAKVKKLELRETARLNAKARIEEQKSKREKGKFDIKKWHDNAFLRGRAAWNDMYGSVIDRNTKYFAVCILLSIALLISTISLAYMGSQSKIQPYIVQVGTNGDIVDVSSAIKAPDITNKIVKYFIQQFIINLRSISGDNIVEKSMLARVYAAVNTANNNNALSMVKAYIQSNNPFAFNAKFTNQINIQSIFPVSENTYQIAWEEIKRTTDGKVVSQIYYTGQFSYKFSPSSEENFQYNPFGIYITNISWSEIQTDSTSKQ